MKIKSKKKQKTLWLKRSSVEGEEPRREALISVLRAGIKTASNYCDLRKKKKKKSSEGK